MRVEGDGCQYVISAFAILILLLRAFPLPPMYAHGGIDKRKYYRFGFEFSKMQ